MSLVLDSFAVLETCRMFTLNNRIFSDMCSRVTDHITPTSVERDGSTEKHNSAELQTKEASGSGQ